MDDAIDQMQKTAKAITLFEVHALRAADARDGDSIVEARRLVSEAVPLLRAISKQCRRASPPSPSRSSKIEGQADDLHDAGLQGAVSASTRRRNPMAFIIGNEIYDHLEKVVDRFEDVANEINGIVIEHV